MFIILFNRNFRITNKDFYIFLLLFCVGVDELKHFLIFFRLQSNQNQMMTTTPWNKNDDIPTFEELNKRSNIYDNDEFDIFHREKIDLSKVNIGKRFHENHFKTSQNSYIEFNFYMFVVFFFYLGIN